MTVLSEMTAIKRRGVVINDVLQERRAQDAKWGEQNHPDGTGYDWDVLNAQYYREKCDTAFADGRGTYKDILREEVFEAFAEKDPEKLKQELIQVAAVAVAWVEKLLREDIQRKAASL